MKRTMVMLLGVVFSLFILPVPSLHADDLASDGRIHQKFKLLPGKGSNRYEIYIPFEVGRPGRIRVYHEITGADVRVDINAELPNYILADARIFDKGYESIWAQIRNTVVQYHPSLRLTAAVSKEIKEILGMEEKPKWFHGSRKLLDKNDSLILDVDDRDLNTTKGRYVLVLRNPSPGEYHGNILISFPGEVWEVDPDLEAAYERKPDLAVKEISLDRDNRVLVTLSNEGPGWLHEVRYNRTGERVISLDVEVNGKKTVSVPLADVDPKFSLKHKGNKVTYRTEIQLSEPASVMAVIDAQDVVAEDNERNNKMREKLTPHKTIAPSAEPGKRVKRVSDTTSTEKTDTAQTRDDMPDLVVTDIFLDTRRRVSVRVDNRGAGISPDYYRSSPPVQIRLFMNDRSWAYVPLASFDATGALRQPGGSTVWTSDQSLRESTDIRVVLDEGNLLPESTKANNTLTKRLTP